mgnify:CR=1 FL=1
MHPPLSWPAGDFSRIPFAAYCDPDVYEDEQERIFRGPTWNYLALEAELPEAGDFLSTKVGETPVVVNRDSDGVLHAFVNRCMHRGMLLCRERHGNSANFICPYHQWTYTLGGDLTGMPFKRGINGKGGLNPDFDMKGHGLVNLRVESLNGVVFASFDHSVPPLKDYLGPDMVTYFTRIFDGRVLRIVGYERQIIDCNWKLQMENLKEFHPEVFLTHVMVRILYHVCLSVRTCYKIMKLFMIQLGTIKQIGISPLIV